MCMLFLYALKLSSMCSENGYGISFYRRLVFVYDNSHELEPCPGFVLEAVPLSYQL